MATPIKRLLAVSWAMPPMLYPRSIQVARLLSALSQIGWESTVICNDPEQSGENDDTLSELYDFNYRKISVAPDLSKPSDALTSQWLEPALQTARVELKSRKYSAFVTFAQPWVDHLIGLEIRKEINIPWIAHFSDPWTDNPYYSDMDRKHLKKWRDLEREVIRQASAVVFTNSYAMDLVMRRYPSSWRRKSYVVPHAFDAGLADRLLGSQSTLDRRLHMIYTGDLYGKRSAGNLFKALEALCSQRSLADELNIRLIGRITKDERSIAERLKLERVIEFHDQLPYVNSLQACATADILLLIDAPSPKPSPFLPSKLVDYLMFKKPILGLTSDKGASADLLRSLGSAVVSPDDVYAIVKAIDDLLIQWHAGNLKPADNFDEVASNYHPQKVGLSFHQILSNTSNPVSIKFWWQSILSL